MLRMLLLVRAATGRYHCRQHGQLSLLRVDFLCYRTKPYKFPMHCSKCVSFSGTSYSRPPIDPYLTSPLLQNPGGATVFTTVVSRTKATELVDVPFRPCTS